MGTQNVSITIQANDHILVRAPYNTEFTKFAKSRGAKWDVGSKGWLFDRRDDELVRDRCMADFGHDGVRRDQVDVRVTISENARGYQGPIAIFGRSIACASGRDSGATLCNGIAVESGGFTSGGSMKNWLTKPKGDTTVIIRDWSRDSANALLKLTDSDYSMVEIIEPARPESEALTSGVINPDTMRTDDPLPELSDADVDLLISGTMRAAVSTEMLERLAQAVVDAWTDRPHDMLTAVTNLHTCLHNRAALKGAML